MERNYFRPSDYDIEKALREISRYESIYVGDNFVMKKHKNYIELNFDSDNPKGHVSYNLYLDENGKLIDWKKHPE